MEDTWPGTCGGSGRSNVTCRRSPRRRDAHRPGRPRGRRAAVPLLRVRRQPPGIGQPAAIVAPVSVADSRRVVQVNVSFVARPTRATAASRARLDLPAGRLLPHGRPDRSHQGGEMPAVIRHRAGWPARPASRSSPSWARWSSSPCDGRGLRRRRRRRARVGQGRRAQAGPGRRRGGRQRVPLPLNGDNDYWAKCTAVPTPNAVNDVWNRVAARPAQVGDGAGRLDAVHDRAAARHGYSKCTPGAKVADSMIDADSRTLRIRVTGRARAPRARHALAHRRAQARQLPGLPVVHRLRDQRPVWYSLRSNGRPTAARRATSQLGGEQLPQVLLLDGNAAT